MLLAKSSPAPNELPAPPPDTWCPKAENGVHHWVVARVLPTLTQAAGWLHQCTLCDEQHEQATEQLARPWPPRCKGCGMPKFRPKCDTFVCNP